MTDMTATQKLADAAWFAEATFADDDARLAWWQETAADLACALDQAREKLDDIHNRSRPDETR